MSFPTNNINNTFVTAPTSPNPYVLRKLNNMDQAQVMKREREDWSRLYHKTLKGIEAMIDVQRAVKDMKKLAEEAGTTVVSRSLMGDFILFFLLIFISLYFSFSFNFLFLEQLGLRVISHAVTSVTT